ncbi:patatin-like phospholipase family protein [Acaryochloris sp. CCMEE 5410]|uniref:patatin-like phospholipase family protein n=1 Tax=Acaryochloris sp. CCMEE 5410 TaxID=310037 RepID=UPI0002484AC1|nr:patatin-like phospholipase family protein [Acaryochloris sp. CCMEE 5410]KAI9132272.1 patatin-like phospholipase family protein [Acaryochloris sp. CCMEE 5410]
MPQTVGLALGSGGARGWAHIGALRALEEASIEIHYVAGTSIGAVVGAFYAVGELDALEEYIYHLDWKKIVSFLDFVFPRQGLLDGDKVYGLLADHLLEHQIEDTQVPFCCVATNLSTQQAVCIDRGLSYSKCYLFATTPTLQITNEVTLGLFFKTLGRGEWRNSFVRVTCMSLVTH